MFWLSLLTIMRRRWSFLIFLMPHINDWKEKNFKEQMHWAYLNQLPWEGKQRPAPLVDGLYDDKGKKVRDLPEPQLG